MIGVTPAGPAVLVVLRCDPVAGHKADALIKVGANPAATVALSVAEAMIDAWPPDLCAAWGFVRAPTAATWLERYDSPTPTVDLTRYAMTRGWGWPPMMGLDDWLLSLVVRLHLERAGVTS